MKFIWLSVVVSSLWLLVQSAFLAARHCDADSPSGPRLGHSILLAGCP